MGRTPARAVNIREAVVDEAGVEEQEEATAVAVCVAALQ
jgi:hypothetical protein